MKEQNSPFAGLRIGWLDLGAAGSSEIYSDGKQLELNWKKTAENRFSAMFRPIPHDKAESRLPVTGSRYA